jgi:ATP-dependent 26S proteasome regulatory subunit
MTATREYMQELSMLVAHGDGAPSLPQKLAILQRFREQSDRSPISARDVDCHLLTENERLNRAIAQVNESLEQAGTIMEKLTVPPWFPALFVKLVDVGEQGLRARVCQDRTRVLVTISEEIDPESLQIGDEVFLNNERNTMMARAPVGLSDIGETATFDRYLDHGRIVVRHRDEEIVAYTAGGMEHAALKSGDVVRWNHAAQIAYEKLPSAPGRQYLVEDVPDLPDAWVGGQAENLDRLLKAIESGLMKPKLRKKYQADEYPAILMVGPPGCGKTLLARIAIAAIQRRTGKKCSICIVKPSQFEDPYVGITQRNIRDCFKAVREAASDGYAVMFLDEVESLGRIRGSAGGIHADKFLNAFLTEVEGFEGRVKTVLIAATNRPDLLDPAVLERLGEVEIHVNRPDMLGARSIFEIHMDAKLPFHSNGVSESTTRQQIIESALSRLYSPNADNKLCTIRFRDGSTQEVCARDLISGRLIAQTCRQVRQTALLREERDGDSGIRMSDMDQAITHTLARLYNLLTPRNCHAYLSDLPQDVDVVAVEKEPRPVDRPLRYLTVA